MGDIDKTANTLVRSAMREIGVRLSEIVTKGAASKESAMRQITDFLVKKYAFGAA